MELEKSQDNKVSPVTFLYPLRWLFPASRYAPRMQAPSYPPDGQNNHHSLPRRVSFAQEPWANEAIPLIDNGSEPKDTRPIRQSVLNRARSLANTKHPRSDLPTLPYYVIPSRQGLSEDDSDDEEDDEDPDAAIRGMWAAFAVIAVLAVLAFLSYGRFRLTDPELPTFPHRNYADELVGDHGPNRVVLVKAKNGAVATENELCSNIGVETLKQGGNAADAAVSSTLCIGVVNMFSSGIGGGGVATIRIPPKSPNASSEVYAIDFREMAPKGSNSTMYAANPTSSMFGGLSAGVPGEMKGLATIHSRWGKLPWSQVVAPAAKLARGWRVSAELARRIKVRRRCFRFLILIACQMYDLIMMYPDWQPIFAPNQKLLVEGDWIRRTALAHTLHKIGTEGPQSFYKVICSIYLHLHALSNNRA